MLCLQQRETSSPPAPSPGLGSIEVDDLTWKLTIYFRNACKFAYLSAIDCWFYKSLGYIQSFIILKTHHKEADLSNTLLKNGLLWKQDAGSSSLWYSARELFLSFIQWEDITWINCCAVAILEVTDVGMFLLECQCATCSPEIIWSLRDGQLKCINQTCPCFIKVGSFSSLPAAEIVQIN